MGWQRADPHGSAYLVAPLGTYLPVFSEIERTRGIPIDR
jgi:hypothetical protein